MNCSKLSVRATIPTGQYANIQPEIEFSGIDDIDKARDIAMGHIERLFAAYSEKGAISRNEITVKGIKKSFNEDIDIAFDPIAHTYHYVEKKLTSATEFTKKFYKEFDSENISAAASKSWGVKQDEVKDLWKSNGDLTSEFGTVIHKALEHYTKFKAVGNTISAKKEMEENYAMPKHPLLKSIIDGFIKVEETKGDIVPEALITNVEKGICGHADRVVITDKKKKVCDVEDFKINIGSEEITKDLKPGGMFSDLPANKLTKYQIQMSIYANMLEASGWKVGKLVVYVFEGEWKRYELPVLQVI